MREEVELLEDHPGLDPQLADLLAMLAGAPPEGMAATRWTSIVTAPALGSSRKLRQRRNVLLPDPDRPRMAIVSRGQTVIEQPRSTWLVPKYFSMSVAYTIGSAPCGVSDQAAPTGG